MKTILYFVKPYKKLIFLTILFMIFDVVGALYIPKITADMINNGVNNGNMEYIVQKGITMLAVSVIAGIATVIGTYLTSDLSAKLCADMRKEVYKKSLKLSNFDFKQLGTASMITRSLNDVNFIGQGITYFIQMVLPVPFMCIIGIIMAFSIDKFMGFLIIAITAIILTATIFVTKYASRIFERLQKFLDKMYAVIRENITGVRVIRAFNKEKYEKRRMGKSFEDYAKSAITTNRLFAGLDIFALVVINLTVVLIMWIGGNRVGSGSMQIGDITAVIEYAILILFYIIMAQMVIIFIPRAVVCIRRVQEVLDMKERIKDGDKKIEKNNTDEIIKFENVTFKYDDADENTLNDLSFTCKKGETTAIIGSTGSGKSTIAGLIMRFFDVTSGKILLKNQDIREISQKELREHISYVPQTAWLFSGTIEENLKYGKENATENELKKALEIAQSEFVMDLEKGLQAEVSQGGKNFSGGQKQRLSIARAIAKNADLYIFDDSFSALDFKTDSNLRKALEKEMKDSAVLIIAQRINTIMSANQIIVLDDGKVVGIGTHKELINQKGVYAELYNSQFA